MLLDERGELGCENVSQYIVLPSSFCDELQLSEALVACALQHVQYKTGQFSRTSSICQLSGQPSLSSQTALNQYANKDPVLGKALTSNKITTGNVEKNQRFRNWKLQTPQS